MKNKKRFVPWLIAAVIIAAFAVIGKKLYDLMFGGSLAVTTEDLKNGIIACSPAIIFIVVVRSAALIVVVAARAGACTGPDCNFAGYHAFRQLGYSRRRILGGEQCFC
mgnify:CR=1 FL=1